MVGDRRAPDIPVGVTGAAATITDQERTAVLRHLHSQYEGVFTEEAIRRHLETYVGGADAKILIDDVVARRPDVRQLLDVGSGYGSFVLLARAHGLDAVGVELAAYEVAFARRRLGRTRPDDDPETVYREGSAVDLPYGDASFDAVTLWNVIEHVPDYRRAIAEAARVLRPGGALFVLAPNYASFRREAHYRVPWVPLFPKRLAAAYLSLIGRDPRFLLEEIHPCTLAGVRSAMRASGIRLRDARQRKIDHPEAIADGRMRSLTLTAKRLRLLPMLRAMVRLSAANPLRATIHLEGRKAA